jgi:hypothetical protein
VVVPEVETLLNDTSQVPTFTSESSDDSGSTNGVTAEAGGAVTGTSSGFSPGESVDATLHSTPIDLGSFTADSNGDVSFSVTIPATMPSGQHELILMGDTSGLGVTLPVFVPYPPTGPAFTLDAPPTSLVTGSPYLYSFETSGNPASTYALNAGAPSWLSVDDYGDVFGTPPSGTTSFTYSVTASNGVEPDATSGPFTVTVSPPALTPEAPFAILLPIGGLTVFGVLLARRRKRLNVREEIIPDQPN